MMAISTGWVRPGTRPSLSPMLGASVLIAMALVTVKPACADSVPVTATMYAGTQTQTVSGAPYVSTTLNGLDQFATYTITLTVTDPEGTAVGWHLTMTSTTLACATAQGCATTHRFPTNASQVMGVTIACDTDSTCTNPVNTVHYPVTMPAGTSPPSPVRYCKAAIATGLGRFIVTPTVRLWLPANTYRGTYVSTITLAMTAAP